MNRRARQQPSTGFRVGNRPQPALAEIVPERQAEGDGKHERPIHARGTHLVEEIRNGVGLRGGIAPQHLGDGGAAQRPQVLGPEVRVDVDVEIQRATGVRCVTVEEVLHARRARLQVDLRSQQQRHAQMGVDV